MEWQELLTAIFEVCIIPLLGILTTFFVKWVNAKSEELAKKYNQKPKKVTFRTFIR